MDPRLIKKLDRGRRADVEKLAGALVDPRISPEAKRRAARAIEVIADQTKSPYIQKKREQLRQATLNKDKGRITELTNEMRKVDRRYGIDVDTKSFM